MAQELETIWENDIPTLSTAASTTEILVRDPSASVGGRIKKLATSTLYTLYKGLLDAAYGAFVTRWPTFTEVTSKPVFYPDSIQIEANANGSVKLFCSQGKVFKLTLRGNISILFDSETFDNCDFIIILTQDGTGSRTISFNSSTATKWYNASAGSITLSTAAGAVDIIKGYCDATTNRAYITDVSLNQQLI